MNLLQKGNRRRDLEPALRPVEPVSEAAFGDGITTRFRDSADRVQDVTFRAIVVGRLVGGSFLHDPDSELDYALDWAPALGADTIVSSSWEASDGSGLVIGASEMEGSTTRIWLSGGTVGRHFVDNTVVTASGQTLVRSVRVTVTAL